MSQTTYLSRDYAPVREFKAGARHLNRLAEGLEDRPYTLFTLKPLGPIIGAEIEGVDLGKPLAPELKAEIQRAFLEWKVLFFRNQHITSEQQVAFAKEWGELEKHPFLPRGSAEEITRFEKNANMTGNENIWHADVTWRKDPALGSVLRLSEVPPFGGDTLWADMGAAYDNLPDAIKERIHGLTAIHDFTTTFGRHMPPEILAAKQEEFPAAEHPIVRTHPETGRKTLFVNGAFTIRIVGLEEGESEKLLNYLFRQAHIPEYQVRFQWEANSVALWDNRATQHYAVSDYYPHRRVAERVSIAGDRPY
ncbi:TauD/TfdA family dioxygenase [Paenibacillus urinalis]|uniref:TauD/TfdA family dioxygenase n=1 Tax=Paenibacillus urinalis TaxID=521520 RepID=A0AAX3MW14_9BACL|nr:MULTISPECIES: TauD/TfdA family dioxygenase [Paenibacillus]WDH80625.1 TauD/TfdA family dioxygenase [Paenibacillus urinalis]WDH96677.1 TauD/TfdA family dioxygenase [Paenibacillus urinalis]WDI00321.1 TauD/TfdA family dioxygenase [Paenibacillus urinalis]GAK40832.1 taurine dioxygenase [Paenibacillus sp. TCA20]